jgi:hypothetical protein
VDDPDADDLLHECELVPGPGDADNASFHILNGSVLLTDEIFDYETKNSYSIRVRATDDGGLSVEKVFIITVVDVLDTPSLVDLDVDSDNDGFIQRSAIEEEDEATNPGLIARVNPAFSEDTDVTGDYLYKAVLEVAHAAPGGTLTITFTGPIRLISWNIYKDPLPLTYDMSTDIPPSEFRIEAFAPGDATITVTLAYREGGVLQLVDDTVYVTVVEFDAKAFRPQNAIFREEVPESEEHLVGIRPNTDFDPGSEDDLIETVLGLGAVPEGTELVVTRSNAGIRLHKTKFADGDLFAGGNSRTLDASGTYWVEYVGTGGAAQLTLTLRDSLHGTGACTDSLVFRPLTSIVVVILGHGQVAMYPPDPSSKAPGTIHMARELYSEGYDVHLFEEDSVDYPWGLGLFGSEGTGRAFDTVENAINNQSITNVAIFGYSHGGGSTYWLSKALRNALTAGTLAAYDLRFTAYLDAIERGSAAAEQRHPISSGFHTNQFQTNDQFLVGESVPGAADNLDRSHLTIGPLAQPIDHFSLVNHPDVQNLLLERLRSRVNK